MDIASPGIDYFNLASVKMLFHAKANAKFVGFAKIG